MIHGPNFRRQLQVATAVNHQLWNAVDIDQSNGIARVYKVGVFNLLIGMPDFRPHPGILEKNTGDIPEGVTAFNNILFRHIFIE